MNFVVTGGAGFIGSHIVEYLVERGDSITVIDNLAEGKKENLLKVFNKINFVKCDIRDYDLLRKVVKDTDGVFHEAALASVQESFKIPEVYHAVNVVGTENIFNLAKENGFRVVYASSSSVYGDEKIIPIKETSSRKALNPYGQNKIDEEILVEKYAGSGAEIIGLRYFNVYGERQRENYAGVIKVFLENMQKVKPLLINGNGLQTRDFVYVGDVVNANLKSMESNIKHAFINIGSGKAISILDIAKMIVDLSGFELRIEHGPPLIGEIRESEADIILAKRLLKWKPKTELRDWLCKVISSYKKIE